MGATISNQDVRPLTQKKGAIAWLVILGTIILGARAFSSTYNGLVSSDQMVQSQWAQVQNVYQRRLDLVPNLVETVKGAANFEKSTFLAVTEARANAERALGSTGASPSGDAAKLANVQQTQRELSSALSRLMVVVENYPNLKATENFRDLQAQLEGTENRITVERMRFNETAQAFNSKRLSFPTSVIAGFFGSRFAEKAYFKANDAAQTAPKVKF